MVWGFLGSNYNISDKTSAVLHNIGLFSNVLNPLNDFPYNPCISTAPIVQCGGHGNVLATGSCTYLNKESVSEPPTCEINHVYNGNEVTITIVATDKSGIFQIFGIDPNGNPFSSPLRSISETSNPSYTYTFTVNMNESGYLYFLAKDHGGNTSQYFASYYIDKPIQHDYSITQVSFSPSNPTSGQTVAVSATLKNVGTSTESSGQQVKFFVDGVQSSSTTSIPSLEPNATTPVNFSWIATNGAHNLKVQSYLSGDQNADNDFKIAPINVTQNETSPYPPYINLTLPNNDVCHDECFITWNATDPDNNALIYLYYDNNNSGLNGTCINPGNPLFENNANGYSWNTVNMSEGVFWIYATIDDGTTINSDYSPGYIEINHPDLSSTFGYSSKRATEDDGDGDGIIEAGESFDLDIWIRNLSYEETFYNVESVLTTSNPNVEITSNQSTYGTFTPRENKKEVSDFDIQVDAGYSGTVEFELNITFQDEEGYEFYQIIGIPGINISQNVSPAFQIVDINILDDGSKCNHDGILQSGENGIDYTLKILNIGSGKAFDVEGIVMPFPPELNADECNASYPDINVGSSAWPETGEDFDVNSISYSFSGISGSNLLVTWGEGIFSQTIPFDLEVFPTPWLRYTPESYDFGVLLPGDTARVPIAVWNIGTSDLVISQIENLSSNSENWITGLTFPVTISPSDTVFAFININRGIATNVNETFRIYSNNHTTTIQDIVISGTFFEATPQGYVHAWSSDPLLNQGGEWAEPADLDNDGLVDIVTFWRANLYFWEQTSANTLTFELKYTYTIPGVEVYIDALRIGNCDGDNKIDIIVTEHDEDNGNSYTVRIRVFESSANNQYSQTWYANINFSNTIDVGNCDSDINDDIVVPEFHVVV